VAIAALGIVASIFRAQSDRLSVRLSRSLVVLVGLTDDAMPLVRRLSTEREADTRLTIVVGDPGNRLIKSARGLGARVVICNVDNLDALRSLLTARGRFKVRAFYAVAADAAENLRWAAQLRAVADPPSCRGRICRHESSSALTIHGRPSTGDAPTPTGRQVRGPRSAGSATR
jgi:hypothetical protein